MGEFEFQKFRRKKSILPMLIAALAVFLIILLFRNCNSPNEFWNGRSPNYGNLIPQIPEQPNRPIPIDTTKIVTPPEDPLKRKIISNLLNVYLQDTVNIEKFSTTVVNTYAEDSLKVTYYADAYKRVQFKVPSDRRKALKESIKEDFKSVKFACYETIISQRSTDPGFNDADKKWFYEQIGLFEAWKQTMGDPNIKIAVIDNSFDLSHKELKNQFEKPWNVIEYSDTLNTYGKLKHGTHVAGTAVGEFDNNFGISGVAPKCKLIPIQISDQNGRMTTTSILDGIFYALKNGADVINMSLGQDFPLQGYTEEQQKRIAKENGLDEALMWNEVYEIADKEGVIIVQAAGNSTLLAELDPMKRSKVTIVVGATNKNKKIAKFSNYGNKVSIYAPGVAIYSSVLGQKFEALQGTSMASPIIAGCVGLIKSINKDLSAAEIKELMVQTGAQFDTDKKLIQINKILLKIKN